MQAKIPFRKNGSHRPVVGLALGSGGARGLAHIGVIKVLLKHNIPIDLIAGTSAGALIGGLFCAWQDIDKIEREFLALRYRDWLKFFADPAFKSGLFHGTSIVSYLNNRLSGITIDRLQIPFGAVATDLISGDTVAIREGNLAEAIKASSSLPGLLRPSRIGNKYLIDGGTSEPTPALTARNMEADLVIAVNLDNDFFPKAIRPGEEPSITQAVQATIQLLRYHLAIKTASSADIIITPGLAGVKMNHVVKGQSIIAKGEKAAEDAIPMIKKALKSLVKSR